MAEQFENTNDFAAQAAGRRLSLAREFWEFVAQNKKWWLLPILIVMVMMGALVLLNSTGLAPLIYTIF